MSLSYCVGLVYRCAVLVVRGVELSNDFEADTLVKLSIKRLDHGWIVTDARAPMRNPHITHPG